MAGVRSVSQQFRVAAQESLEAVRKIAVGVAKTEHARVMRTEPRPTQFQRYVDGREGAPEESLRLGGVIVYDYPRIPLVARFALEVLYEKSPFGRPEGGHYREQHVLHLNGVPGAAEAWQPGDEVEIINAAPYARKIEIGAMKMVIPGTDHVYAQAEQVVRRTYGELAYVSFAFRGRSPALIIRER